MTRLRKFTDHVVKSIADFTTCTRKIQRSWESSSDIPDPWYRGMSSITHELVPSWFRLGKRKRGIDEDDLQDEFQRRAIPLLDGGSPLTLWEWYFLTQHYGLPTRLLDWSESSLVGLYFAVGDWKGAGGDATQDAVVWMLDPWYLNKWSKGKAEVFRFDESDVARYLPRRLYDADRSPKKPVALLPPHNSRRLTAQRGVFTMHGKDRKALDKLLPAKRKPHLARIRIPKDFVAEMRADLRTTGITDVTLFPEMPYLCQDILKNWGLAGAPVRGRR
jgi:hypothetical protein